MLSEKQELELEKKLHRIIDDDDADAMQTMIDIDPIQTFDKYDSPLLCLAACAYSTDVALVLLHNKANTESKDKNGYTPLHLAILGMKGTRYSGQCHNSSCVASKSMVHILLGFGANVEARDKLGNTAVHMAAQGGVSYDVLDLLMEFGAMHCLLAKNLEGFTARDVAVAQRDATRTIADGSTFRTDEEVEEKKRAMEFDHKWANAGSVIEQYKERERLGYGPDHIDPLLPTVFESYKEAGFVCDQLEYAEETLDKIRQKAYTLRGKLNDDVCRKLFQDQLSLLPTNERSLLDIFLGLTLCGWVCRDYYRDSIIRDILDPDNYWGDDVFDGSHPKGDPYGFRNPENNLF
jgi:hypothetical protein